MEPSLAFDAERELVCEGGFLNASLCDRAGIIDLREKSIAVVGFQRAPAIEMITVVDEESACISW